MLDKTYIFGPAGTGKTTKLVGELKSRLKDDEVSTVLSFTKKDAQDISDRANDSVQGYTLASIYWRVAYLGLFDKKPKRFGGHIYYPPLFLGMSQDEILADEEEKELENINVKYMFDSLDLELNYPLQKDEYSNSEVLSPVWDQIILKVLKNEKHKLNKEEENIYNKWLRVSNMYGFMLPEEALAYALYDADLTALAIKDANVRDEVEVFEKLSFLKNSKILAIDEAQDINSYEMQLIQKMLQCYRIKELIVCGDPNQTIYGDLKGANDGLIKWAEKDANKIIVLTTNYRSSLPIDKFNDSIINSHAHIEGIAEIKEKKSVRIEREPAILYYESDSRFQMCEPFIDEAIEKRKKGDIKSIALLAHSLYIFGETQQLLNNIAMPFQIKTQRGRTMNSSLLHSIKKNDILCKNNFFNYSVLKDVNLNTDGSMVHKDRVLAIYGLCKSLGLSRISIDDKGSFLACLLGYKDDEYINTRELVRTIYDSAGRMGGYEPEVWEEYDLEKCEPLMKIEEENGSVSLFSTPIKNSDIAISFWRAVGSGDTTVLNNKSIHRIRSSDSTLLIAKSIYEKKVEMEGWDYKEFCSFIDTPMIMSNIHQFKGNEADYVIACTHAFKKLIESDMLSQLRLFYVMCSRARDYLRLVIPLHNEGWEIADNHVLNYGLMPLTKYRQNLLN